MSAPAELDIYQLAEIHRAAVIAREQTVVDAIVDAYRVIAAEAERQLDDLMAQVAAHVEAGGEVSQSWLRRQETLERLLDTVERQVRRVSRDANGLITNGQRDMVTLGEQHARQLMLNGMGTAPAGVAVTFNRMNPRAVEALVGFLGNGSPLSTLLDDLGPDASQAVRKALLEGIGLGRNPRRVAFDMRKVVLGELFDERGIPGGLVGRANTIARTEMLRVYRAASSETYKENADILEGWVWLSALDDRTCAACMMLHGSIHPTSEKPSMHPNCRCTLLPQTVTWEDILGPAGVDVPDTRVAPQTGEDWFLQQSPAKQLQHLGPSKYAAWRDGAIDLQDLVAFKHDAQWGGMHYEASLKSLLGDRAKDYYGGNIPPRELPLAAD